MFQSLGNLFRYCLVTSGDLAFETLVDNNALHQSLLISSTHHLWTLKKARSLVKSQTAIYQAILETYLMVPQVWSWGKNAFGLDNVLCGRRP